MSIAYSPYTLQWRGTYPSFRKGALVRVRFPSLGVGYADCHPWPELGDLPLEEQLQSLITGKLTALTAGTWQYAKREAEARGRGVSLLNQKTTVKSHFLITDLCQLTGEDLSQLAKEGYTHLKIKLGKRLEEETKQLLSLFFSSSFILRLDFNERLTFSAFRLFLEKIVHLRPKIDFIEDPFPWQPQEWVLIQQEGWILACDRQAERAIHQEEAAQVLILKPATHPFFSSFLSSNQRLVVTSYLGHSIEQIAAASIAAEIDPQGKSIHGLLSHHAYFPNVFSQKLNGRGPNLVSPPGKGNGFDRELEQLTWIILA